MLKNADNQNIFVYETIPAPVMLLHRLEISGAVVAVDRSLAEAALMNTAVYSKLGDMGKLEWTIPFCNAKVRITRVLPVTKSEHKIGLQNSLAMMFATNNALWSLYKHAQHIDKFVQISLTPDDIFYSCMDDAPRIFNFDFNHPTESKIVDLSVADGQGGCDNISFIANKSIMSPESIAHVLNNSTRIVSHAGLCKPSQWHILVREFPSCCVAAGMAAVEHVQQPDLEYSLECAASQFYRNVLVLDNNQLRTFRIEIDAVGQNKRLRATKSTVLRFNWWGPGPLHANHVLEEMVSCAMCAVVAEKDEIVVQVSEPNLAERIVNITSRIWIQKKTNNIVNMVNRALLSYGNIVTPGNVNINLFLNPLNYQVRIVPGMVGQSVYLQTVPVSQNVLDSILSAPVPRSA